MRILLAPLAMPLKTMGPARRAISLAQEAIRRRHELVVCMAEDGNLLPSSLPQGARVFPAPCPNPLGLPPALGHQALRLLRSLGLDRKTRVTSFEQVLFMGGHLSRKFFARDVSALRRVIHSFRPDVVLAEYRVQAIVAAQQEGVPVAGTHSFPGQASFAATPRLSRGVRAWLRDAGVGNFGSVLKLFEMQRPRFVASSPELEPFDAEVIHVGPLGPLTPLPEYSHSNKARNIVTAYMGNGGLVPERLIPLLREACAGTGQEIYVAGGADHDQDGLHVAPRFDFSQLLPRTAVFLNHGGQNSVMDGLLAGAPQLLLPGQVFERDYNARAVERIGAGLRLDAEGLDAARLRDAMQRLQQSDAAQRAAEAGAELASLGGAGKVLDVLERQYG